MTSTSSPSETSLIRQIALDLLEQAYQTDPSQTLSREHANRLEGLLARHFGGTTEGFNRVRSGPDLDKYIDQVIKVALHLSSETWTGFCSWQSNRLLRETGPPLDLPVWKSEEFFPELHLNRTLSEEERSSALERVEMEREALMRAFRSALDRGEFEPRFFGSDDSLYLNYYEQVCLEKGVPVIKCPPPNQTFVELGPKGVQTFTIPTRQFVKSILEGRNPLTGSSYSVETIQRARGRFPIELKLLKEERSTDS
uniref:Uncharacterized protein n=1 Tax=viral metagenome TaxID=1070528 RepID=A0A6C0IWV9_9ZZZZ